MDSRSSQETPREDGEQVQAQYEGEDVRLTSRKELSGWYSYGFAAEVFAICAMGKPLHHTQTTSQSRYPNAQAYFRSKPAVRAGIRESTWCSYRWRSFVLAFVLVHAGLLLIIPGHPLHAASRHDGNFHNHIYTAVCLSPSH
jgi:hypothetical protein